MYINRLGIAASVGWTFSWNGKCFWAIGFLCVSPSAKYKLLAMRTWTRLKSSPEVQFSSEFT